MFSCTTPDSTNEKKHYYTYGVDYISGGEYAFILRNILSQRLLTNDMLSEESSYRLRVSLGVSEQYLSTAINKITTRVIQVATVNLEMFDINRKCAVMKTNYKEGQTYKTVASEASLSSTSANNDIFMINIGNISELIIDDLMTLRNRECLVTKKYYRSNRKNFDRK
ncbi:hypothetical protein OAB63_00980 [Alphaproteobacteria bacterium]|nr:hypothetical protein [Alphaproteobacteria bacterium]